MNKKSTTLLMISISLLLLLGSTTFFIIYIVNTIDTDAKVINDAGIIRGSIQRIAKLEANDIQNDELINDIDKRIHDFKIMSNNNKNRKNNLKTLVKTLDEKWTSLKDITYKYRTSQSLEDKKLLLNISEDLWMNTNATVYETQIISENKVENFKVLFPFLAANLFILLFLIYIIKNYVRDQLENVINKDPLTKIYNRHFYQEKLRQEIQRAERYGNRFSLMMFDIDHFKKVNDTFGHDVGDYVLKELSKLIQNNIRGSDIVARIGGEEFAIIAPETDINNAAVLAEKLRKVVEEFRFKDIEHITISFGVSQYIYGDTIDDVFKRADIGLYKAKNNGRNRVELEN